MARRRYLIAYDIADQKRLQQIAKVLEAFGDRIQYSVFLCDLSLAERLQLEQRVLAIMDAGEDSIMQIDLGPTHACAPVRLIGRGRQLPGQGPQIV